MWRCKTVVLWRPAAGSIPVELASALWRQTQPLELAAHPDAIPIPKPNLRRSRWLSDSRRAFVTACKASWWAHVKRTPQPAPTPSMSFKLLCGIRPSRPSAPVKPSPRPCYR